MADNDFRVKNGIVVGSDAFISNSITQINSISFNTTQDFVPAEGSLAWSNSDSTLSLGLSPNLNHHLGQDSFFYVINQTGSTIFSNTVVMANGTVGSSGAIKVSPAIGNGSFPSDFILGVTPKDIPDGELGFVTNFGKICGINTSMFSEGDVLYLDAGVPGRMMNTAPVAPNNKVTVAIVITKSINQGEIFVRPTFEPRLKALQDVAILDVITDGQALVWKSANLRFENETVVADQANVYNTYITLTSNTYNTLLAAQSNDYNTLFSAYSNDYATLLSAQSNDGATLLSAQANDFNSYTTLTANDYNSFTTLTANIYNTFAYLNANVGGGGGDVANAWVNANDYTTFTTLTANIYNTFAYLNANVGGGGGGDVANAWVNANDFNTYTTLTANIYNTYDYLQANGTGVTDNLARTLATLALP